MAFVRLQTTTPDLVELINAASVPAQRRAALAAARLAVSHVSLNDPAVVKALDALARDAVTPELRERVAAVVESLDDEAWTLQEQHADVAYKAAFAAARAADAVNAACDPSPTEAAYEAAYEAQAATGDPALVSATVRTALLEAAH